MGSYSRLTPGGDWDKEGRISLVHPSDDTAIGKLLLAVSEFQPIGFVRSSDQITDPTINALRAAAAKEAQDSAKR